MAEKTNITGEAPPEMIAQDIARTRQEMSGTVNEIQDRLSPGHVKERAREGIRDAASARMSRIRESASTFGRSVQQTAKDTGASVADVVRNNPIPLAMIGAGIAWLVFTRTQNGGAAISEAGSSVKEKAGQLTDIAQSKMQELSSQTREAGSELADKAGRSAASLGRAAQDQARSAGQWIQRMIVENPLGIMFGAFGIGALVGLLVPESLKEKQLMGSASESLLSRAKETARHTIQKAQHAAERAVQSAGEDFKKSAA